MADNQRAFFVLVRAGIGHGTNALPKSIDWESVRDIAAKQGLVAVAFDGLNCLSENDNAKPLPLTVKLRWMGEVLQGYEQRYQLYKQAIAQLARFYNSKGYRMMLLKGLACGMDWPRPEHRPYGDIDIWLFGCQQAADKEMVSSLTGVESATPRHNSSKLGSTHSSNADFRILDSSFRIDNSHHHHSVFKWQGFTVENHFDFMNVHHHKSNAEIEKTFKDLANDDSRFIQIEGEKVYLPSPNLNALFLLRHAMAHFAAEQITIRHLLDWAFFVKAHKKEVDWDWLDRLLDGFGMMPMYQIINAICVEDLGFDAALFTNTKCDSELKERVLMEILSPEFSSSLPKGMVRRVVYKFRRWKGNEWKHRLCYNDSMTSALWAGVKSHLMKPASI